MTDVVITCVLLLGLVLLLVANIKKKGGWVNASSFVLFYYCISFLCAVIMAFSTGSLLELIPTVLFSVGILGVLWPIITIDENRINSIGYKHGPNSIKSLDLVSKILAVVGIFLFFYYIKYLPRVFSGDISANRIAMVAKGEVLVGGALSRVASLMSAFYLLMMVLAFYRVALARKITWVEVGLIMGTLAEVFHIFSQFGRDGVVFWIVSCALNLLLYWKYLENKLRQKVLRVSVLFIGLFLAGFMAITVSRFGAHKKMSLEGSIVSYYGQHIHNYADVYHLSPKVRTDGYISFPFFIGLKEGLSTARAKSKDQGADIETVYRVEGKPSGVFASFLRDWSFDFGRYGAVAMSLVLGVLINFALARGGMGMTLSKIVLYNLYALFLFQGVFYFRMKFVYGNFMILLMVLVYLILSFRENAYLRARGIASR